MPVFHPALRPQRLLPLREGRSILIAAGLVLTVCAALLLLFPPLILQQSELRLYDHMLAAHAPGPSAADPLIVGIDEESLEAYGQWPWPRYRLARLVERLRHLGAAVIALDFLMPEPDRTSPGVILAERQRDFGTPFSSQAPSHPLDINSQRLAAALAGGKTVLGYYFEFSGPGNASASPDAGIPPGMVVSSEAGSDAGWPVPKGVIRNIAVLTASAAAEGFTNAQHDIDGVLRRTPLLIRHQGKYYPSLAFAAILLASPDRNIRLVRKASETLLVQGGRPLPLDYQGNFLIDFRGGKKRFPYISAKTILHDAGEPGNVKGKIVLVGTWAKGLGDLHIVPSGRSLSGLEIHATVIDSILGNSFISRPSWARAAELLALVALGLLSSWLFSRPGFVLPSIAVVAGSIGCYWGARALLISGGLSLSPLLPMLTPVAIMTVLGLLKYSIEARKVQERSRNLIEAQDTIIMSMSALSATRDEETGGHILRTRRYVEVLARQLATLPHYSSLDERAIELLAKSAPLHDIGKVGIPDTILRKSGILTEEEYAIMKTHTLIGSQALSRTIGGSEHPENLDFLTYARQMVESHHEKWDGSGYPHGLRGADIHLAGRLMAVADVYDALVSKRVYKHAVSHEDAKAFILRGSGKHFDPEVVDAFMAQNEEFLRIAREFADRG